MRTTLLGALALAALSACPKSSPTPALPGGAKMWAPPPAGLDLPARVIWDFEHATIAGVDAWVTLFDFAEVGAFEILLHRYDLLGRHPHLTDGMKAAYAKEDGTPYPADRERRNVGRFHERLAKPVVGTGGCTGGAPQWEYNRKLTTYEPLPPGHEAYEPLRQRVLAQLEGGGVIAIRCTGGAGGLALVYSPRDNARGYDLVTIYDDGRP